VILAPSSKSPAIQPLSSIADESQLSSDAWRLLPAPVQGSSGASRALWCQVRVIIENDLTVRQREVVELYFLRGLDQDVVAALLGISQQSVSEHLFGKMRNGTKVGGVIRKLRKLCEHKGLHATRLCMWRDAHDLGEIEDQ